MYGYKVKIKIKYEEKKKFTLKRQSYSAAIYSPA